MPILYRLLFHDRFSQWREEGVVAPEWVLKKVPHCHLCCHPGELLWPSVKLTLAPCPDKKCKSGGWGGVSRDDTTRMWLIKTN